MNWISLLLSLSVLLSISESKVITPSIPYNKLKKSNNSVYITKFSLDIGRGEFKGRARFNKPLIQVNREDKTSLTLGVVLDDRWEEY